ncbi:MAG: DNA repair protein RecO [Rhizobiales bacterium]|nr:DNA repair protein RecO [Hyphomicrobiales bacterium]
MQWTDEGIVIGVRRHGEASAILELMTRAHGRHLGLVRGGFGSRMKPILQTGNSVAATWRARLDEHLGNYTVEPLRQRASDFFGSSHAIYGVTHLAALMRLLPERDPHAGLYSVFEEILDRLEDPALAAPLVVRFELQLLGELGFGLDLAQCAATGTSADLIYVSPKSGRAVSRDAGEPWADKMLRLPGFLRDLDSQPAGRDLADGFALTGFFLDRHVLEPRGLTLTDERAHFIAALLRGPRSALVVERL